MSRNTDPVPEPAEYAELPESSDLALLSAYLDNALSAAESAAIDQRLRKEPIMQADLDALRQTQAILRAAPVLSMPPRAFTLDPALYSRRSQQRIQRRPIRILGLLGAVAAVAAALIVVFGLTTSLTNQQAAPGAANAVLIASNPTVVPATPVRQTDALSTTAVSAVGSTGDSSSRLQASDVPTIIIPSLSAIPMSPTPVLTRTPLPVALTASPTAITPAAAAAIDQQGGSASSSSGQVGSSGGQDIAVGNGGVQPNLGAPIVPTNGLAPVAPSLLIAATATVLQGSIAPTSAKTAPSAMPLPSANRPASTTPVAFDLPTVLKVIWWVLVSLFGGQGLR